MMSSANQQTTPLPAPSKLEQQHTYSWLRTLSIGFALVSFCIALAIGGYIFATSKKQSAGKPSLRTTPTLTQQQANSTNSAPTDSDTPPLLLKSIGINVDYYDPKTKKAGDFVFTKQKLQFDRLFMGFGFVIPADISASGKAKANPQPTFILPLDTPVRSLVDGVVANMPTLWSGDISIQVTASGKMEKWVYETEHVTNPKVKVGDKVSAGQIIAEVSNFDKGAPVGFGAVEIGILKGGNPPKHVCPFLYLDPSIKESVYAKLRGFYKAWNEYTGKVLYDEAAYSVPGCLTTGEIEG